MSLPIEIEMIEFKVRSDISKLDDSIEQLWVEIQGTIKILDSVLSIVKSTWNDNIMITGDSNINLLASTGIQKRYIEVLETYDLNNDISNATRIGKKLIEHIISNIPANKILHSDVLPCPTISDPDAPYIIANIPANKFETRYKYIRNLKNFELEKYVEDLKALPISLVYFFDDPNDQ